VKWIDNEPHVIGLKGTKEVTVAHLVSEYKHDPEFAPNFYAAPNPNKPDEDGVRRISASDQQSLNRFAEEIASGKAEVIYDEPKRKKLDENMIDIHDSAALNDSLEDLASGKKSVVFSN
jgi:hypothetical protein